MKPIEFPQQNAVLAKDQPQYTPLPVYVGPAPHNEMISCWEFTDEERAIIAAGGKLWFRQLTFGHPFQPVVFEFESPWPEKCQHSWSEKSDGVMRCDRCGEEGA